MLKQVFLIIALLFVEFSWVKAQAPAVVPVATIPAAISEQCPATIIDGDTVAMLNLQAILVLAQRTFKSTDEALRYYKLCRDVKIAYPYAIMAEATFRQCCKGYLIR